MELHKRGWQVYRAYIDEKFDFVILKSYCENCEEFKNAWTREQSYGTGTRKTVTPLCDTCHENRLKMLVRFIQVKTSEGINERTTKSGEEIKIIVSIQKSVITWRIPEYFTRGYKFGTKTRMTSTTTFSRRRMSNVLMILLWILIK